MIALVVPGIAAILAWVALGFLLSVAALARWAGRLQARCAREELR